MLLGFRGQSAWIWRRLCWPPARSEGRFSDSSLTAVRVGNIYRITKLQLSYPGTTVGFPIPKHEMLEASQTTHMDRNVPVLQAAK